jgi:hypothetical protein
MFYPKITPKNNFALIAQIAILLQNFTLPLNTLLLVIVYLKKLLQKESSTTLSFFT